MKIRTRLLSNLMLVLFMMIVLIGMTLITNHHLVQEIKKLDTALNLAEKGSRLVIITNEYLARHYDRQRDQWHIVHRSMTDILGNNHDRDFAEIRAKLALINESFTRYCGEKDRMDELVRKKSPLPEIKKIAHLNRILLGQTNLLAEEILKGLFGITTKTKDSIRDMRSYRSFAMLVLTIVMIVSVFINSQMTIKKITVPLQGLVNGARMIAQGSFGHRIDTSTKELTKPKPDEMGELISAFNMMSGRIEQYVIELRAEVKKHFITGKKLEESLVEKEVLLKEIHHRVKNNMQVVSSLLGLQSEKIIDETDRELFRESQNRVYSMALIHEMLYRSDKFSEIDFGQFIESLAIRLKQTYSGLAENIEISVLSSGFSLEILHAIPCGLIINELICNCFKHAFNPGQEGVIDISLSINDVGKHVIKYHDNGRGIGMDVDISNSKTLGMQLIYSLVGQIKGQIELVRDGGTTFNISF